ncbi:hypothetical protein IL306_001482 [Fusarium sp. DS 682]|nr:hypothetical protein IL306_001482 [Fusarium sp. DS 682]
MKSERPYVEVSRIAQASQKSSTSLRERKVAPKNKRTSGRSQDFIIDDSDDGDYSDDGAVESDDEEIDTRHEELESEEDSEENEKEYEDDSEDDERPKLQRPKLIRESPMDEREVLRTPERRRGPRYRNDSFSALGSLSYPKSADDAFAASPGSVTSPDPSEIFTPFSSLSTPYSISSTVGHGTSRSSFRTSFYRERYMESPVRKKTHADDDLLSRDMMRKMKINADDSGNESDEIETDGGSSRSSSSRRSMTFHGMAASPVHNIMDCLAKRVRPKSLKSGYIYCFAESSKPGFLKIGFVRCPEYSNPDRVEQRLKRWKSECKHHLDFKFKVFMPCAAKKIESLIHETLHRERQVASCPSKACKSKRREWFKTSEDQARRVVEVWQQFSKLKPYDEKGTLKEDWKRCDLTQLSDECIWSAKEWLTTEWIKLIANVAEEKMEAMKQELLQTEEVRVNTQQMLGVLRDIRD